MQKLKALRELFEEVHQCFEESILQLKEGRCPTTELGEKLQSLQYELSATKKALVQEALAVGVPIPENLEQFDAIEHLHESIKKARRDKLRVKVEGTLDQILSLSHREEATIIALNQLRDQAQSLLREDADLEQLEKIAEGSHPFLSLLRLIGGTTNLNETEKRELSSVVESTFGKRIVQAITHKQLSTKEEEFASYDSLASSSTLPQKKQTQSSEAIAFKDHSSDNLPEETKPFSQANHHRTQEDGTETPSSSSLFAPPPPLSESSASLFTVVSESPQDLVKSKPVPIAPIEKTTDTLEELDALSESKEIQASSDLVSLTQYSYHSSSSSSPSSSSSELSSPQPATDEVPVIGETFTSNKGQEEKQEEKQEESHLVPKVDIVLNQNVSSDQEFLDDHNTAFPPVPSIEALAIAAMNEVLLPSGGTNDPSATLRAGSSTGLPTPPSTPKLPSPTFLTPLPLSVSTTPSPSTHHVETKPLSPEKSPLSKIQGPHAPPSFSHHEETSSPMPTSSPTSSPLSSSSLTLDAYDAMMIRTPDPNDPSRNSPLTKWQEHELNKQEYGVAVLFGSSALGLEDLPTFTELVVGSESHYVVEQTYAPSNFISKVKEISSKSTSNASPFILLTQQTPWDSSWVRDALELVEEMKSVGQPLRIAFVADPPSTWSMIPSIQPLQQDGVQMLSLQPWHDSALLAWLEGLQFASDPKIRRSIQRVTGNWSFALKFFYRQMKQNPNQWARHLGSLKQVLHSKELAQKALRIMGLTHKTTLSILQKLTVEEPATQEAMERAFSHAPPRLIARALLWAERLNLVRYENYFWSTTPLVARLIKALR